MLWEWKAANDKKSLISLEFWNGAAWKSFEYQIPSSQYTMKLRTLPQLWYLNALFYLPPGEAEYALSSFRLIVNAIVAMLA